MNVRMKASATKIVEVMLRKIVFQENILYDLPTKILL